MDHPETDAAAPTSRPPSRRRLVAGATAVAALPGLVSMLRVAMAGTPPVEAPDGRPALQGRAPVLFVGHGSPMNAIQDNDYTRTLRRWGRELGLPRAILVVSAHWLTDGELQVSLADRPSTLHDFSGFPAELQAMRYPAPGAPDLARLAASRLGPQRVVANAQRGLDHGAWTVLHHLYPAADVPVFQLSVDITRPGPYHLAVGRALAALRDDGVLILGSGNVVHNLRETERDAAPSHRGLRPWAEDFDQHVKAALDAGDTRALAAYETLSPEALRAVPFPDHYFPLLAARGAAQAGEAPRHVHEGFQGGTLSMRCIQWG